MHTPAEGALEAFSDETKSPSPSQLSPAPSSGPTLNPDPASFQRCSLEFFVSLTQARITGKKEPVLRN